MVHWWNICTLRLIKIKDVFHFKYHSYNTLQGYHILGLYLYVFFILHGCHPTWFPLIRVPPIGSTLIVYYHTRVTSSKGATYMVYLSRLLLLRFHPRVTKACVIDLRTHLMDPIKIPYSVGFTLSFHNLGTSLQCLPYGQHSIGSTLTRTVVTVTPTVMTGSRKRKIRNKTENPEKNKNAFLPWTNAIKLFAAVIHSEPQ